MQTYKRAFIQKFVKVVQDPLHLCTRFLFGILGVTIVISSICDLRRP